MESSRTFLPAAGADWLLPLYDPFVKLFGIGNARNVLLAQADLKPGHRVLDIGCGTGTFAVQIKQKYPNVEVTGLDPDPKALARAEQKAKQAAVAVKFDKGFSDELPYPDRSFDRVCSSFMFHHLPSDVKEKTLSEIRRVLKPGGFLDLLDFGGPGAAGHGIMSHIFHANHRLDENSEDTVLAMMKNAGLNGPEKLAEGKAFFGFVQLNYFHAIA
jgi:ubiquinone/menaquinone biosynthesis C-methylase UbiE